MKHKPNEEELIQYTREEADCLGCVVIIGYDDNNVDTHTLTSIEEISESLFPFRNNWIDLVGLTCKTQHASIAKMFQVPLEIVDAIISTNQQPKMIIKKNRLLLSVRMVYPDKTKPYRYLSEQICFIIADDHLLSFQTQCEDVFVKVEECLFEEGYFLRNQEIDALMLELLKAILENYELLLSSLVDKMEQIEEAIINQVSDIDEYAFSAMKKKCNHLYKITIPLEDIIQRMIESKEFFVTDKCERKLKSLKLKVGELIRKVEEYDDDFLTLYQMFMSYKSNNLNNVMKTLTMFSAIFMPLTLMAGIYGMNFKHFPELEWQYGYYALLGTMVTVVIITLSIFKIKKWF